MDSWIHMTETSNKIKVEAQPDSSSHYYAASEATVSMSLKVASNL